MAGISIKKIRLYYYIRRFYNSPYDYTHYHVDDLTVRRLPHKYWYDLVIEAYNLSKSYITKKQYGMNVFITMYVKIKKSKNDNTISLKDIKPDYMPYYISFYKNNLDLLKDILYKDVIYSKELSELFGKTVYMWHADDDRDYIWSLFLV